ncbi:MAG: UDP-N-acetylmuramoyl-tripeptide--D-alanyl-D-alanine ligase [Candidatus Omnitrophota bacterium]|nr:UDP-N-acetylmuramoyl-tripeptide--D-alanyl-D-alanine ligase [Candidatus Omnitrophota bacterium]
MFTSQEVLRAVKGKLLKGDPGTNFKGISIDSRSIKNEELFVAIKGKRFDGHDFVSQALAKAGGAVVSKRFLLSRPRLVNNKKSIFLVKDTLTSLGDIASSRRNRFKGTVLAVTGTTGKTTTTGILASVLKQKYKVLKSEASFNNFVGLPLTLFKLNSAVQIAVLEMGTSGIGEIKRLAEISRPDLGVIINIGPAHLGYLGNLQGVYRAKLELLEAMDKNTLAAINGDDKKLLSRAKLFRPRITTFGMNRDCDFRASEVSYSEGKLRFVLNGCKQLKLKALGRYNVYNALAAISLAGQLGLNFNLIKKGLADIDLPPGRMEVKKIGDIRLIDDSYNSNPLSLGSAIDTLAGLSVKGKKILVSGDMLELGSGSESAHQQIGKKVASSGVNVLITVGNLARQISRAACRSGMKKDEVFDCGSIEDAMDCLKTQAAGGDIILVKGSRATRMERVVENFIASYRS